MPVMVFAPVFGITVLLSVCEVFVVVVSEAMVVCFKGVVCFFWAFFDIFVTYYGCTRSLEALCQISES